MAMAVAATMDATQAWANAMPTAEQLRGRDSNSPGRVSHGGSHGTLEDAHPATDATGEAFSADEDQHLVQAEIVCE